MYLASTNSPCLIKHGTWNPFWQKRDRWLLEVDACKVLLRLCSTMPFRPSTVHHLDGDFFFQRWGILFFNFNFEKRKKVVLWELWAVASWWVQTRSFHLFWKALKVEVDFFHFGAKNAQNQLFDKKSKKLFLYRISKRWFWA